MLKITVQDTPGQLCFELAGRLVGAWVSELEHCWYAVKASQPHRQLAIDLTSVTFIDHAGRYLLQLMHRDGVRFVASGLMQQDIMEHITGPTK
jgi:anti-anti-sigma regulatory factor